MDTLIYLLMVLLSLAAYALAGVALWVVIEGGYWLYCKITGRDY